MKISACIITNNNTEVIKAIESVYDSVSEIILVNTVDSLSGELQNFIEDMPKIQYYYFKWNDSFSDARNYAISKASGDWILKIDSDEVLSSPIVTLSNDYDFYSFYVQNGLFDARDIRIFKNHKGYKYSGMIHETVEPCINDLNSICYVNDLKFIHNGLDDKKIITEKMNRNLRILLKDTNNPLRDYHLCNLYWGLQEYSKCIEHGLKSIEQPIHNIAKGNACIQIFNSYERLNEIHLNYLWRSLIFVPVQIYARYKLLEYLYNDKQFSLIEKELNNILGIIKLKNSRLPNDIYPSEEIIKNKIKEIKECQDSRNT